MLVEFAALADVSKMADAKQQEMIAEDLIEDFQDYTIADFKLFFKRCRKGYYGSSFGTLDEPTVYIWLRKFIRELDDFVEEKHYAEHVSTKGDKTIFEYESKNGVPCPPEVSAKLDELLKPKPKFKVDIKALRAHRERLIRSEVHKEFEPQYQGKNVEEQLQVLQEENRVAAERIAAITDEELLKQ